MNEEQAWRHRVNIAKREVESLTDYVAHPDKPHDYTAAVAELSREKVILWAAAELTRLRAIVARVEDVEAFIRKEMLYDHPGDAATVAKKIRDYAMGEG